MTLRIIESKFHDLRAAVEIPDHVSEGMGVAWLRDHNPTALKEVCPHDGCDCEIDEWDRDIAAYNVLNQGSREIMNLDGPMTRKEAEAFAEEAERDNDVETELSLVLWT